METTFEEKKWMMELELVRRQPKNPLNGAPRGREQQQGEVLIRLELEMVKGEEEEVEGRREHVEPLISKTSTAIESSMA